MTRIIENQCPLQPDYKPEEPGFRKEQYVECKNLLSRPSASAFLRGATGSGKTELAEMTHSQSNVLNKAFIPCTKYDTHYKALSKILELTGEEIETGHHTAELQRQLEEKTSHVETLIVLDDVEFLLLNDGDELLYMLSRQTSDVRVLLTSSSRFKLSEALDERTYSSLNPLKVSLDPPTGEDIYQVLASRAKASMRPRSLHEEALTLIASTTQNLGLALTWLRESAKQADDVITEEVVQQTKEISMENYALQKLEDFSSHHEALYHSVKQALGDKESTVTGKVLDKYKEEVEEPLTSRQLSTYLKHLEKLGLIESEYKYGGELGKTRIITWNERCRL